MKKQKEKKNRTPRRIAGWICLYSSIASFLGAGLCYLFVPVHATGRAKESLFSHDGVEVSSLSDGTYCFDDGKTNSKPAFVFYQGGKVEREAYAPLMFGLAKKGIRCYLPKMPANYAFMGYTKAKDILSDYPKASSWAIGGHSLGGAMAAHYLSEDDVKFSSLVLLAAYSTDDLSKKDIKTLSLTAGNDKVLNWGKYAKYKSSLPSLTEKQIDGGVHSYFGDYGIQNGDGDPTITLEERQEWTVSEIASFLLN